MNDIREKDWKLARSMKKRVLDLACKRILEKASKLIESDNESSHAKYLELWALMRDEDQQIGSMFNNFKRSAAIQQISLWQHHGLITNEEFSLFTPETRERI
jgi:hypothetical protein